MVTPDDAVALDGRRLRRDRNREAVVEALLELYREGNVQPSADEIAARAGISARSLFRYFDDVEALVREAIHRQQEHLAPYFEIDVDHHQPLDVRIDALLTARLRLLQGMGHVGHVARSVAPVQPLVAAELERIRGALRAQVAAVFEPELAAMSEAEAREALAAADVLTSWEAFHLLRDDQGLTETAAAAAMRSAVLRLLAPAGQV